MMGRGFGVRRKLTVLSYIVKFVGVLRSLQPATRSRRDATRDAILAACQHVLVTAGYQVETREGIVDLCEKGAVGFDLILIDVQMPELFGDDVAGVLRHQRSVETPIYLFSTLPEAELRERAAQAQVDGFVSKNGGTDYLLDEVKRIIG